MMFLKECKKTLLSFTFLLYAAAVFAMYFTQFEGDFYELITPPIEGPYARLFCDYMGIVLSIMPVFTAASLTGMDERYSMNGLIYTRKVSSFRLIFTRFTALVCTMIIPAAVTVVIADFTLSGYYPEYPLNPFILPMLALVWLIPNIMLASAMGMLVTELSSPIPAIFIYGAWWVTSLMSSSELTGNISWFTLVCRHNSLYEAYLFYEDIGKFIFNRIFYTLLSLILISLAAFVYEQKRRGNIDELLSKLSSKNNRGKSAA